MYHSVQVLGEFSWFSRLWVPRAGRAPELPPTGNFEDFRRNFEDFLRISFILEGNSKDFLEFPKNFEDFRDLSLPASPEPIDFNGIL